MPLQTHFVGLDVVFEDNFALKILEIQNMFSSQVSSAKQVTGKDPKERLVRVIAKQNPDITSGCFLPIILAKKSCTDGFEHMNRNRKTKVYIISIFIY